MGKIELYEPYGRKWTLWTDLDTMDQIEHFTLKTELDTKDKIEHCGQNWTLWSKLMKIIGQ